jgi:hypothetical protein
MRTLVSLALATTLVASSAFAADSASPLAAGKPAGVHQAQAMGTTTWVLLGVAAMTAVVVGVAAGSTGSSNPSAPPLAVTTTTV